MVDGDALSPVVLFTYNRVEETERTLKALQDNFLAEDSVLYIFSDGPKNNYDVGEINKVRAILNRLDGFRSVKIFSSDENKGLANSVINGVDEVLKHHDRVIVVEDDLVTSPNFLDFMNQALNFYAEDMKVASVSGFTLPLSNISIQSDYYFGYRASSWGWGTWKKVWQSVDWGLSDVDGFFNDRESRKMFRRGGSYLVKMLSDQLRGNIDSWAIRFCYHQFQNNMVTVYPSVSKARNIGFKKNATHTSGSSRFSTNLESGKKREFLFENAAKFEAVDPDVAKAFRSFFTVRARIKDRLRKYSAYIRGC